MGIVAGERRGQHFINCKKQKIRTDKGDIQMKSEKKIIERLEELAEKFIEHYRAKEYIQAKRFYDTARTLVVELNLGTEVKMRFFGNKPYVEKEEDLVDGLFPESAVLQTYEESWKNEEERIKEEKKRRTYQMARYQRYRKK